MERVKRKSLTLYKFKSLSSKNVDEVVAVCKKIEFLHPKMGFKTHKFYCGHKGAKRATTINFKKYLILYHNSAITLYLSYL